MLFSIFVIDSSNKTIAKLQRDPAIAIPLATYCIVNTIRSWSTRTTTPISRSFPRPSLGDQRHRCGIPRSRRSSHFSIVTGRIHDPGCPGFPSPFTPAVSYGFHFFSFTSYARQTFFADDENRFAPASRQRAAPHSYLGRWNSGY